MIAILAMALMLAPMVVLWVCELAAKNGRGPLAEPNRMPVLDGAVGPAPTPSPVFTDPGDAERCATEGRLVRELLDGTLDRTRYHAEMAALAAATASPPVRLPGEPGPPSR
jgi:hypothetical protein